jgi:hypothetical protein
MSTSMASVGPNVVNYNPPPFDVLDLAGLAAAAFSDYPLN